MVNDGKEKFDLYKFDTKEKIDKKKILLVILILLSIICLFLIGKNVNNAIKNYQVYKKYEAQILTLKQADVERQKQEAEIKEKEKQAKLPKLTDVGKENMKHIYSSDEKRVFLTFDDGPSAVTTKILNTLKQANVKATFFVLGSNVVERPELVKQMIDEGHIIGNHTVNHKSMPSINNETIEKEIMQLHQSMYEKFGYEMKYLRPPKGEFNERTLQKTSSLGYKTVMWSFAYCDWDEKKQPSQEEAIKIITKNFHSGEIMLLHSNSKTNSEVLDKIIKEAKNQGYEFKSLDEFKN